MQSSKYKMHLLLGLGFWNETINRFVGFRLDIILKFFQPNTLFLPSLKDWPIFAVLNSRPLLGSFKHEILLVCIEKGSTLKIVTFDIWDFYVFYIPLMIGAQ